MKKASCKPTIGFVAKNLHLKKNKKLFLICFSVFLLKQARRFSIILHFEKENKKRQIPINDPSFITNISRE